MVCITFPSVGVYSGTIQSAVVGSITSTISRLISASANLTAIVPHRPGVPDTIDWFTERQSINLNYHRISPIHEDIEFKTFKQNLTWTWKIVTTARVFFLAFTWLPAKERTVTSTVT